MEKIVVSRQITKCQKFVFGKYHVNKRGLWAERIFILDNCTERPIESLSLLYTKCDLEYTSIMLFTLKKEKRGNFTINKFMHVDC